jgi:hypothetical protein
MHTKINIHQIDPNFLKPELWSKTRLGMQHVHLKLLWILIYAITKKNKHISGINISGNYKIVINSTKVYFGVTRQHEEVGHKNLIIVIYKNHLDRLCRNGNQIL